LPDIAAAVLAAGGATRMGRDKTLLDLGGEALVRRSVSTAATSGINEIMVVVNPHNQASSDSTAAGLLLLLVDQPLIDASMLAAIVDAWHDARPAFVASAFGGVTTTPVLFDRSLLPSQRVRGVSSAGTFGQQRCSSHHVAQLSQ
jgi:CTP:molybdopterin cytidylyltransferase MocA